jgi:hypothetical protein
LPQQPFYIVMLKCVEVIFVMQLVEKLPIA